MMKIKEVKRDTPIGDLFEGETRIITALKKKGFELAEDLLDVPPNYFRDIPNIGKTSLEKILKVCDQLNSKFN